jgi:RimJ/RimL family protein N-acetyltransferase
LSVPAPTARLAFRLWRDDDLPLAMALWGDPRVARLVGGPFSDEAVAGKLATELVNQRTHGIAYWPLVSGGADVGCCGLKPRSAKSLELGFYLRVEAWGQGLAAEAARSVIAYAFGPLDVPALFAGHHPDNLGSRRTLEQLGFRYTHHEHYAPTGLEHPGYELLR